MNDKEIFRQKAIDGYTVCLAAECPLREHCLRWRVGEQMPDSVRFYTCVNPLHEDVATQQCPEYRPDEKVTFARGMVSLFNDDMPRRLEPAVRYAIIGKTCRTYYYEYRNGQRVIPPRLQLFIRDTFLREGWTAPVHFDTYFEDYDW